MQWIYLMNGKQKWKWTASGHACLCLISSKLLQSHHINATHVLFCLHPLRSVDHGTYTKDHGTYTKMGSSKTHTLVKQTHNRCCFHVVSLQKCEWNEACSICLHFVFGLSIRGRYPRLVSFKMNSSSVEQTSIPLCGLLTIFVSNFRHFLCFWSVCPFFSSLFFPSYNIIFKNGIDM